MIGFLYFSAGGRTTSSFRDEMFICIPNMRSIIAIKLVLDVFSLRTNWTISRMQRLGMWLATIRLLLRVQNQEVVIKRLKLRNPTKIIKEVIFELRTTWLQRKQDFSMSITCSHGLSFGNTSPGVNFIFCWIEQYLLGIQIFRRWQKSGLLIDFTEHHIS